MSWELTRSCAFTESSDRASVLPRPGAAELTARQCHDVVDQIAEMAPRILVLTGDPGLCADIPAIVDRATARGLWVAFRPTIDSRISDANFADLRRAGVRSISLRLDGAGARAHDTHLGMRGSWDRTLSAFTAARRARIPVQIGTTLSNSNISECSQLARMIWRLQPSEWRVSLFVPSGPGDRSRMLDAARAETVMRKLCAVPAAIRVPLKLTDAPQFQRIFIQSHSRPHPRNRRFVPLNDGRGRLFISHSGEIQPGRSLPISCGNVKSHHALDVYREAPIFQKLRNIDLLKGKCGRCEYRLICGGSRARSYAVTGDYLAEEPSCAHQPGCPARQSLPADSSAFR